jgi:hypothetical protein
MVLGLEVLFAVAAWLAGVIAVWTVAPDTGGAAGEGVRGVALGVTVFTLPFALVCAHLLTGRRVFVWVLLAVALLQIGFGLLSAVEVFALPPLFSLLSAACAATSRPGNASN